MNNPQDNQLDLTGPGKRLMEARCALNLTREEVARQLRLKQDLIRAIEEDRIDELPAPIYVLGYLKNYAKLLKLPHEPVIDAYQQLRVEAPEIINDIVRPPAPGISSKLFKWGSAVIGIILIAGLISWLQTLDLDIGQPAPVEEQAETAAIEELPVQSKEGVVTGQPASPADAAELVSPVIEADEPAAETVSPKAPPAAALAADDASAEDAKIALLLTEDCWVEIRDADGKIIIYDLLRKGPDHQFSGKAPFKVFLGNARAVQLSVNGEAYDVSPHIRGKLARFTLETNASPE